VFLVVLPRKQKPNLVCSLGAANIQIFDKTTKKVKEILKLCICFCDFTIFANKKVK